MTERINIFVITRLSHATVRLSFTHKRRENTFKMPKMRWYRELLRLVVARVTFRCRIRTSGMTSYTRGTVPGTVRTRGRGLPVSTCTHPTAQTRTERRSKLVSATCLTTSRVRVFSFWRPGDCSPFLVVL
jgi:hypothetical protein